MPIEIFRTLLENTKVPIILIINWNLGIIHSPQISHKWSGLSTKPTAHHQAGPLVGAISPIMCETDPPSGAKGWDTLKAFLFLQPCFATIKLQRNRPNGKQWAGKVSKRHQQAIRSHKGHLYGLYSLLVRL